VSGHAQKEEIKMLVNMVKPQYFIPVHGEYKHRRQNAEIARSIGVEEKNIVLAQNGDTLKLNKNFCRISGNINLKNIYIDGLISGNTEDMVLKDRKILSRNGIIFIVSAVDTGSLKVIKDPEFMFKGIAFIEDYKDIISSIKKLVNETILKCFDSKNINNFFIEKNIVDTVEKFILKEVHLRPIIEAKVVDIKLK
jgi:ribonuclease J